VGELGFLRRLHARIGQRGGRIVVDSGDDCAVLRFGRERVLYKIDTVIEGVHFARGTPWRAVGRKAVARALSDIAAMGGVPCFGVVAAVLGRRMTDRDAREINAGLESWRVPIVGGDLKSHAGPCIVSVSLLGEMRGAAPVRRTGAKPGDVLLVTGPLGNSIAGHHLTFTPRLKEGRAFATTHRVHAMIDISDGLVRDLEHLGVGADLDGDAIPCRGTLKQALYDGEDYEQLVAAPRVVAARIERAGLATRIGTVSRAKGIRVRRGGRVERAASRGYEHRFGVS
jgi:thiamine-monophosphate kinase